MERVERVDAPNEAVKDYREREELARISAKLNIPTNDDDVRKMLRENGELAELPQEAKADRRSRLTQFLAKRKRDESYEIDERTKPEVVPAYVTLGSDQLLEARKKITQLVLKARSTPSTKSDNFHTVQLYGSQSGFQRAVSAVRFYDANSVLVGDWSGTLSMVDLNSEMKVTHQKTWPTTITGLSFRNGLIAVSTANNLIHLVKHTDGQFEQLSTLTGHTNRVSRTDMHPHGGFLVSASFDQSWILWDLNTMQHLFTQEGHQDRVCNVKINPEGSLVSSCGFDKQVKIWDLRSGIQVLSNANHMREVYAISWISDTKYATAGADNRCLIWDLRNPSQPEKCLYAHTGTVTDLVYSGSQLASASHDCTIKFWNTTSWTLENEILTGSKVMSIDENNNNVVAGRWDRHIDWCLPQ